MNPIHEQILKFVTEYQAEHGYAPTWREIQRTMGWPTVSMVTYHMRQMREAGLVTWDRYKSRTLRLVK